jgi:CrcB protein
MRMTVAIAVAGALGALSRHGIESLLNRHRTGAFPWGTFLVNVSGSFILGLAVGLFARRFSAPLWLQAGVTVGFLGAYTTFSTLSLQIYRMTSAGSLLLASANAFGSLAAGTFALYTGVLLTRVL